MAIGVIILIVFVSVSVSIGITAFIDYLTTVHSRINDLEEEIEELKEYILHL